MKMLYTCRLGHSNVFELIHQHDLFASVSDHIVMLMEFDNSAAVKMLLDNTEKIPVCYSKLLECTSLVLFGVCIAAFLHLKEPRVCLLFYTDKKSSALLLSCFISFFMRRPPP